MIICLMELSFSKRFQLLIVTVQKYIDPNSMLLFLIIIGVFV